MSKIRRVDYSPDEFLSGTSDLDVAEKGAYWVVCSLIYSRGGPIPDDAKWIATVAGCSVRMWSKLRERLVGIGKLKIEGGFLSNKRAAEELLKAENRVAGAREAAEESARVRRERLEKERELSKTNGLAQADASTDAQANHQPPTTKESKNGESLTVERGARAVGDAPPKPDLKGARLPKGWRPEGELRQWTLDTIKERQSQVSAGHELERFVDYWRSQPGAKGRKTDWAATWRNWIRKAIDMEGKQNGTQHRGNSRQGPVRSTAIRTATNFAAALGGLGAGGPGGTRRGIDGDGMEAADASHPSRNSQDGE